MNIIRALLALLFFTSIAHATTIEKEIISFDIKNEYQILTNITLSFQDITTSNISYFYTGQIKDLKAYINGKEVKCLIKDQKIGTEISCYKPAEHNITAMFLFYTKSITQRQGLHHFSYELPVIYPTKEIKVMVLLPEGSVVANSEVFATVTPENYKIESDKKGRRFIIVWNIKKPELGKTYLFSAYFESQPSSTSGNTINKKIVAIIAISSLFAVSILFYLLLHFRKKQKEKIIEVLVEDEKKVIDAIKELGQGCKQKDVVKLTGFSKAKVSRIIEELKNRNVIEVERVGKHNKLYLKN